MTIGGSWIWNGSQDALTIETVGSMEGTEMTRKESEALRVGDRIRQIEDDVLGTVIDFGYRAISVKWDDGQVGTVSHADADAIEKATNNA